MATKTVPVITTHVCVMTCGAYYAREHISCFIELGAKVDPHATVRLRPGERLEDAAWRHTRAEARYWASL